MSYLWGCTGFDRYSEIYMQWSSRPKLLNSTINGNDYSIVDPAFAPGDSSSVAAFA